MVVFSHFNTIFNMPIINIFNTPWNFNIVYNMHYSFQHTLKFSTCCFNIVFNTYYSFQHTLKFSTCCFNIVFNPILQFSTCFEMFNMLFNTPWNIQHSFELALQFSTWAEIFNILFQHTLTIVYCRFRIVFLQWRFSLTRVNRLVIGYITQWSMKLNR